MTEVILFFPKSEEKDVVLLPASVLMVAAPLVQADYKVKIIDQRTDENWRKSLLDELKHKPLAFGVSALTGKQILNGLEASKLVKENSDTPVVWGGVHPSLLPRQTLENKYIDFVVVSEGEETFLELVNTLKTNPIRYSLSNGVKSPLKNIKGLGYKKGEEVFLNPPREFIDLDELPEIPYNLINIEKYIAKKSFASGKPGRDIAFYTSRGCPYRCGFCYNKEFNRRRWRGKSAERVVEEMKRLIKDYQISSLSIIDDEFFIDVERAGRICELILKENIKIEILTNCRVNYVANNMDDEYLKMFYRAGFRVLGLGIESGSKRILELIHKDITIDQVFETLKKLKKASINSKYCFMAGFPTETIDDLYKTTDLIQKMKKLDPHIRIPVWRVFTPYPGTDLYKLAIKEGWQPPKNLEEWASYDFSTVRMPWVRGKKKKIIKNAVFLIRYLEVSRTVGQGIFFKLAKIFGKLADWRWKNHLFLFVPEKYIVNFILKFKNFLNFSK